MPSLILAILLAFYPYTVSLSASDVARGQVVTATISAPAGSSVALVAPSWVAVGPIRYLGGGSDTYSATLTIARDAPDASGRVVLLVDGVEKNSAGIRVGTPAPVWRVWLPWVGARRAAQSAPPWGGRRSGFHTDRARRYRAPGAPA